MIDTSSTDLDKDAPALMSSVSAALRLLKAFGEETELGTTALSQRLGLSKSTVHRLANSLKAEGFLEQNTETKRYRLGLQFYSLGALARGRMKLVDLAMPLLQSLRDSSQEAVALVVLDGSYTVVVANVESTHAVQFKFTDGERKSANGTCAGRLLLRMSAKGCNTRTFKETVKDAAHYDQGLDGQGMRSAAALVFGANGEVVAAIVLAGPAARFTGRVLAKFRPSLLDAARYLSSLLGAVM
ncbi:MAG: IclR family transcriptional regulator [Pigmentiphaga sp.]|uniref:IclR family transcriptional regulator n=1 Tax=Pigmentiphaga sp. TaxID=1977564 RepID=UPI0029A641DD|nr:IclR family transcriptional regulator [Pigmentiphaga sp.]MDX3907612.1 IclR family transcriptional regulator [Pigmentiphaga sp.]